MTTLPTLENVSKDITTWRQTRSKRGPIPDELQIKISTLVSRYPISVIAKALGINTGQIKTFTKAHLKKSKTPLKFVRFSCPQPSGKIPFQLKRQDGAILQCELDPSYLNTFIEAFLC